MKKFEFIILIIFLFLSVSAFSQIKIISGDRFTDKYSLLNYIDKYEELENKTTEIKRNLAEYHLKAGNSYAAEEYYLEIILSKDYRYDDFYKYAYTLAVNKKYSASELWMEKYYRLNKDDSRAKLISENKGLYKILQFDNEQFRLKNTDVNSEDQEFAASFFDDKIVFVSERNSSKFLKRIRRSRIRTVVELIVADKKRGELENKKPFRHFFKQKFQAGPVTFNEDATVAAFSGNQYKKKNKDEVITLKLYLSELIGGDWSLPVEFPYNSDEYSVGQASFNDTGDMIFFASDMPGGNGGTDLYFCEKNDDGNWSEPQNLGSTVNTEGDELFPFVHNDGMLFFSSNGLPGLGGQDIYFTKSYNHSFVKPKNPGVPVNSSRDDFAFILDKRMRRGFFSSDRDYGRGKDDIYSFRLLKPFTFDIIIKGFVKDENRSVIPNANVALYNETGNIIKMISTDMTGTFEFTVSPNAKYKISADKPKYLSDKDYLTLTEEDELIEKDLILEKLPDFNIICKINEKGNRSPVNDVKISYRDNLTGYKAVLNSDDKGKSVIKLPEYKMNDSLSYTLTFQKSGYAPRVITYEELINRKGDYELNVSMKRIKIGEDLGKLLDINSIYFDYDKSTIRPDAALELDKIVKIMNDYPEMVIELSSHTDCRGSSIYNLKLSDKRAKASANYIKKKITNPVRIYGDGYGESKLINDCNCEGSKKSDCTEEEHQQNRRTEFKIIRM